MTILSSLTFEIGHRFYGVPAMSVQELFFLPKITPLPNLPRWMIGVINLRGNILPVVDLGLLLGQEPRPYRVNDSVIVLRVETGAVGVVVEQTHDVDAIATEDIANWGTSALDNDQAMPHPHLLSGIAKVAETLIALVNPAAIAEMANQAIGAEILESPQTDGLDGNYAEHSWRHFDDAEWQILQQRSDSLRQPMQTEDDYSLTSLAVIGLQGEYFGLGVDGIREFADISTITPIPCCPSHILGNLNLRGEVVTLIDISPVINLPFQAQMSWQKAIVVRWGEIIAGIAVENIFDVVHLHPTQIKPSPVTSQGSHNDYLQGVAYYQDTLMSVINLPKILTSEVLAVDEEV
jgi:purine-binding chemotaxis protein CheW